MENLFYILAIVAYFLFQGYQNFKKEQEKARKRNPGRPVENYDIPEEVESKPIIESQTEAIDLKPDYKLSKKEIKEKESRTDLVYEKMDYKSMGDYYNPEKRRRNKSATEIKPVTLLEIEELDDRATRHIDFDLQDAVIKEAVLKRPY